MAKGYRPVRRDQEFLLPPRMMDWLSDDHLVWFVLDVVAELDTSGLHARAGRRRDGQVVRSAAGRAGYDPDMLLALLIYAYACGERSSRRIERLCATDVAFRVICAGDTPDHSVLARFRQVHAEVFAELFTQVLRLCRSAGLVKLATVAIDGTKIAANASPGANRSAEWLRAEAEKTETEKGDRQDAGQAQSAERRTVERIVAEAEEVDAAEDALFGSSRGDELPVGWNGREGRRERIRAAQARLVAAEAAQRAQEQAAAAARAERDAAAVKKAEVALSSARQTQQAKIEAWEQAWEQAAANPGAPVPVGRAPVEHPARVARAEQRLARARERLAHPDTAPRPGRAPHPAPEGQPKKKPAANITDPDSAIMPTRHGWLQAYNTHFAITTDQIILATLVSTNPNDLVSYQAMTTAAQHAAEVTLADPDGITTLLYDAGYASDETLAVPTPNRLIALGKTHSVRQAAREHPASGFPPPEASPRQTMDHRLPTVRAYPLRGRLRCAVCNRKMEASPRAHGMYYRCPARTLALHSPVLARHPAAVYVREAAICIPLNKWIATLFDANNRDRTVQALVDSQGGSFADAKFDQARRRLANAEARLRRHQAAIEAGVDPAAIVDAINQAQAERAAAHAELSGTPASQELTRHDVEAMIDSIGDVGTALTQTEPHSLADLYEALRLQMVYNHESRSVDVTVQPHGRVNSARVRGGSCALTTRFTLDDSV